MPHVTFYIRGTHNKQSRTNKMEGDFDQTETAQKHNLALCVAQKLCSINRLARLRSREDSEE